MASARGSASSSCAAPAVNIPDRAFSKEVGGSGIKRKRTASKSIEDLTAKKVYDNFKDFSDNEKFAIYNSHGKNLHDCVNDYIAMHLADPKKHPLGAKQYKAWKSEFRSKDSPTKALEKVVVDDAMQVQPSLMQAAIKFQKTKNKAAFNSFLHTLDTINVVDLVGICQYGLTIRPSASADQLTYGIELLHFFYRMKSGERFPDQMALMQDLFDCVLVEAHKQSIGQQTLPSKFLARFGDTVWLVLPKEATETVMKATTWLDCEAELSLIVKSKLGMRLFGSGLRSVQTEIVQSRIMESFKAMMDKAEPITADAMRAKQSEVLKSLMSSEMLHSLPERRKITLQYLGQDIEVQVKSLHDHVSLAFAANWKTIAVFAGLVQPMFCELELVESVKVAVDAKTLLHPSLLQNTAVARDMAKEGKVAP